MHNDKPEEDSIEIGQTPRVYAPGSVVDENEVVMNQPESDQELSGGRSTRPVNRQEAEEELGAEFPAREDIAGADTQTNQTAHQEEYTVTHNEQAVPNYRDETYRDPNETLLEGQRADKYDEQKRAVDDGSRFIPKNT